MSLSKRTHTEISDAPSHVSVPAAGDVFANVTQKVPSEFKRRKKQHVPTFSTIEALKQYCAKYTTNDQLSQILAEIEENEVSVEEKRAQEDDYDTETDVETDVENNDKPQGNSELLVVTAADNHTPIAAYVSEVPKSETVMILKVDPYTGVKVRDIKQQMSNLTFQAAILKIRDMGWWKAYEVEAAIFDDHHVLRTTKLYDDASFEHLFGLGHHCSKQIPAPQGLVEVEGLSVIEPESESESESEPEPEPEPESN